MGSGNAGFREHLQGLDEALAALHGRLVDGGGPRPRDPAPATARRRGMARRLHSPASLGSGGAGVWRGRNRAKRRGEVKRALHWGEWSGGEAMPRQPEAAQRQRQLILLPTTTALSLIPSQRVRVSVWAVVRGGGGGAVSVLAVVRGGGGWVTGSGESDRSGGLMATDGRTGRGAAAG